MSCEVVERSVDGSGSVRWWVYSQGWSDEHAMHHALLNRSSWLHTWEASGEPWRATAFDVGRRLADEGETIARLHWLHEKHIASRVGDDPWVPWVIHVDDNDAFQHGDYL